MAISSPSNEAAIVIVTSCFPKEKMDPELTIKWANNRQTIMKGIFGALIIQVVILLYELDTLKLFESTLGESSAKDILDIIKGKK